MKHQQICDQCPQRRNPTLPYVGVKGRWLCRVISLHLSEDWLKAYHKGTEGLFKECPMFMEHLLAAEESSHTIRPSENSQGDNRP